jgi:hypothetical protein
VGHDQTQPRNEKEGTLWTLFSPTPKKEYRASVFWNLIHVAIFLISLDGEENVQSLSYSISPSDLLHTGA